MCSFDLDQEEATLNKRHKCTETHLKTPVMLKFVIYLFLSGLLSKILLHNPEDRFTIPEIKKHRWFSRSFKSGTAFKDQLINYICLSRTFVMFFGTEFLTTAVKRQSDTPVTKMHRADSELSQLRRKNRSV